MGRVGEEKKIAWEFAPVGSPHVNGQAERAIRAMKKSMAGVAFSKRITYGEFTGLVSEIESIMNSRPYDEEDCMDPKTGFPLSPEQILGPKASYGRLEINTGCKEATILERAASIKLLAISFWKKFEQIILPGRLKYQKWSTTHENVRVGDVVHISSPKMLESGFRMAVIVSAEPGEDGLIRTVTVRTPTQHIKEVSVHCIKLIVSTK